MSPSLGISEHNLTGLCTVECEVILFCPRLYIAKFGKTRCFVDGRYYEICIICEFAKKVA